MSITTTLTHSKNPAAGWDISACATAGSEEKIVQARILVDDFPQYDKTFDPPLNSWQQQLTQQGQYPGDNRVRLIISNDKGEDTEADDMWS